MSREIFVHESFSEQAGGGFFSRLLEELRFASDTLGYFRRKNAEAANPFCARLLIGDYWGTGEPEFIKEVFAAPWQTFDDPGGLRILRPLVGPQSTFLLGGRRHQEDRKLVMPPFHGDRIRAYGETIRERTVSRLDAECDRRQTAFSRVAAQISLDVILEAVFGVFGRERDELSRCVLEAVQSFTVPLMFFSFLRRSFANAGPWARFLRAVRALDLEIERLIQKKRHARERGEDILSLLLDARYEDGSGMTPEHLRDTLVTLTMAGHETTAIALCWAVEHVCRHPQVLMRLRNELSSLPEGEIARAPQLPYLKAVCAETLRIHPVVPQVARRLLRPMVLGHQRMEPGDQIVVAICLLHENPKLYPEPKRFMPERFLERSFKPYEYCPFGGGLRRCVGAAFAQFEMQVALATLFRRYDLQLSSSRPARPVRRNITMGPSGRTLLRVRLRES